MTTPAITAQSLRDRIEKFGARYVADQDGTTPAALYKRINRAGVYLAGPQSTGLFKKNHTAPNRAE